VNRFLQGMHWLAVLAPAAVVAYLVWRYSVNVPYWDQWALVDPLVEIELGRFPWAGVFGSHNEHRMVFPKLIMLGLARLTNWNVIVELWVSVLLAGCTLLLLLALARPVLRETGATVRLWSTFIVSAVIFSLAQWENWLWGWQIQWFLAALAATSAVALATWSLTNPRPWPFVAGAMLAAIACQYSIASGLAIWVSGAMVLAFHPRRREVLSAWLALAAVMMVLLFIGYESPPHHPSLLGAARLPVELLIYVGNYLSGPLGRRAVIGYAVGVSFVLFALVAALRLRREPKLVMPWIAIGTFAGANAVATAIGRVGFGAEQGLASRYVTISQLATLALVPLGILALRAVPIRNPAILRSVGATGAAALLTFLVVRADARGLPSLVAESRKLVEARACLLRIDEAKDECIARLYPSPQATRHWVKQLQVLGWSGFPTFPEQPRRTIRIESPDGARLWQLRLAERAMGWIDGATLDGEQMTVSGWAGHPERARGSVHRVIVVEGDPIAAKAKLVGEAIIAEPSPNLALHFRDPSLGANGWKLHAQLPPSAGWPLRLQAYLVLSEGILSPIDGRVVVGETVRLFSGGAARDWRVLPNSGRAGWTDRMELEKGVLSAAGWAAPQGGSGDSGRRVLIVVDGAIVGEAKTGGDRPDVVAHFSDPGLRQSGWAFHGSGLLETALRPRIQVFLALGEDLLTPLDGPVASR